jgi:hypothetical protein
MYPESEPIVTPKQSWFQSFEQWYRFLPKRQKISLLILIFLIISIPLGVIAALNPIRDRSKANLITPPYPITPPEQLINAAVQVGANYTTTLTASNIASFSPHQPGGTIEFWINFDQPEVLKTGIAKFSQFDKQLTIILNANRTKTNATITFSIPSYSLQTTSTSTLTTPELNPNTWYHLALTYSIDTNSATLFVNGKPTSTAPYTGPYNLFEAIPNIQLGAFSLQENIPMFNFKGRLDDFHVSDTPRYSSQFLPNPMNQTQADEFTSILWKFNRSNTDSGRFNIHWFATQESIIEYVEPTDTPTFSVCSQEGQCLIVSGVGENQCSSDFDCQTQTNPSTYIGAKCKLAGCSQELCVNKTSPDISTICLYKDEYACFKQGARCEQQTDGNCGWTQTPELTACQNSYRGIPQPSPSTTPKPTAEPTATPSAPPTPIIKPSPTPTGSPQPTPKTAAQAPSKAPEKSKNDNQNTAQQCQDQAPTSPADLYQITANDSKATLFFAPAGNPYTHYVIQYGEGSNLQHSTSYEAKNAAGALAADIYLLKPNTPYTFQVLAFNHCAPGTWSNQMTIRTSTGTNRTFYKNIAQRVTTNINKVLGGFTQAPAPQPTQINPMVITEQQASPQVIAPELPPPPQNLFQRLVNGIINLFL